MSSYKDISEFYSDDNKRRASIVKELGTKNFIVRVINDSGSVFSTTFSEEDDAEAYAEAWVSHSEHYFNTERNK
jgi:hypothetical protein